MYDEPKILLKERKFKAGYVLKTHQYPELENITVTSAFTLNGSYIGDSKLAYHLIVKRGIMPELIPGHRVCSIGYSKSQKKWYGWSHRAICGFKIGDVVKEDDCCTMSGWTESYLLMYPEKDVRLPVGFKAKNLADCKKMAIAFAGSVG